MFTGIITAVGTVQQARHTASGIELTITSSYSDVGLGESIAVDGACLTVQAIQPGGFTAHVVRTSLERTRFGDYAEGRRVNLERALRMGDRLGGHLVQGHVDARGKFLSATDHGGSWTVRVAYPPVIARYLVFKGSVAVEGISLTIAELTDEYFEIAIIPKTWEVTNFSHLQPGDAVNLEVDVIAKYVERLLSLPKTTLG